MSRPMAVGSSSGPARAPRTWPERLVPAPGEVLELACRGCGQAWRIHRDLAGFRLRCDCRAWIQVPPAPPDRRPRPVGSPPVLRWREDPPPRKPPAREVAGLRRRSARPVLQLAAPLLALAAPAVGFTLWDGSAVHRPLLSLCAGLVALAGGALSSRGLRSQGLGRLGGYAEAVLVAFAAAALALAWGGLLGDAAQAALPWQAVLREEQGYGLALLLGVLCPAVFEELAFRGLLQGRASAWLGRRGGALLTALAFGFFHGAGPWIPLQILLGLHLCSLRARQRSLLPGMLEHLLFAALLVLLA